MSENDKANEQGLLNKITEFLTPEKEPEIALDDVRPSNYDKMRESLTAYFNVHSLDKAKPIYPGLVIPYAGGSGPSYLVSTGETSKQGSHVFQDVRINSSGYKHIDKVAVPFLIDC